MPAPAFLRLPPLPAAVSIAALAAAIAFAPASASATARTAPADPPSAGAEPAAASAPSPVARLSGPDAEGRPMDLAALRGHVVFVFFWSTDCPVCLQVLPELRRNLQGWRGRPFDIVAVNQDPLEADLEAYEAILDRVAPPSAQMRMVWRAAPGLHDGFGPLPRHTPTSFVLDRDGRIVQSVRGDWQPALWDDIAERVLE